MHIVIDLNPIQGESRFRGIGRYSLSLARAIIVEAKKRNHDVTLVLSDMFPDSVPLLRSEFEGLIDQSSISIFSTAGATAEYQADNVWRTRASEVLREKHIAALKPDVLHVVSLFEGWLDNVVSSVKTDPSVKVPTAVTLYDLIPYVMPELYLQDSNFRNYYFNKLDSLKRADLLLAISESSRNEAIRYLGVDPSKVVNISAAVDDCFQPQNLSEESATNLKNKYGINGQFVFYVPGGFDPRKNLDRLLEGFARLPLHIRKSYQLVVGSKAPDIVSEQLKVKAQILGLDDEEFVLTGYVDDADLLGLYSSCALCVFPSLHEGFGLPALEAMACGAPVLASNTTSLPEVIGRKDALFDPLSVSEISQLIFKGLTDESFRVSLISHGPKQAALFSWERSARFALDAFENIFTSRNGSNSVDNSINHFLKCLETLNLSVEPSETDISRVQQALTFNQLKTAKKQLFIDISELVNRDAKSGIQRVVRSILLYLLCNPPKGYDVEPVYSESGYSGLRYARHFAANFMGRQKIFGEDAPITFAEGDVFLGLDLTAHLFPGMNTTLHQMKSSNVKVHYVVYDLTPLNNSQFHSEGMTLAFSHWIEGLTQYADSLVCISKSVADEVKEWLHHNPPGSGRYLPVNYFHLGADIRSSRPSNGLPKMAEEFLRELDTVPTFLMVGTVEPRKGYAQAIDAFELLWKKGVAINLVIVGKAGWDVDLLVARIRNHPQLNNRLYWLEGISDEYLQKIYVDSSALLVTSKAEGFGLPLIEAAQFGLPIIARGLEVFKEVAGEHAYYFDGLDGCSLANAIERWLDLNSKNKSPSSTGIKWLTWAESSEKLLKNILPID